MIRELTDSEQKILGEARQEYEPEYVGYTIEELAGFDSGFIAALDYQQAQLAALQTQLRAECKAHAQGLSAEIDRLKLQIKARDILLMKMGIDPARIKVEE